MDPYDDILRRMMEVEEYLKPIREYERLYGNSTLQGYREGLEQEKFLKSALPEFSSSNLNTINSIQPTLDQLCDYERHSSAMTHLTDANNKLAELFTRQSEIDRIAYSSIDHQWHERVLAFQRFGENDRATELALKSHFSAIAEAGFLAQQRLIRVNWESLGSATSIAPLEFNGIKDQFTNLTDMYQSLALSFEGSEHLVASFPPIVSGGPPLEILTSAKVVDVLSHSVGAEEYEEQHLNAETDLEDEIESDTNELLGGLNPELRSVWSGAKEALRSNNPDRGRHVIVSLRELVTHVLHTLAPDSDIQSWTKDPSHFHEGRPTRKSRVYYICREINHGPFTNFMNVDLSATIKFIDLYQHGTHSLDSSFTDMQLRALVVRTESLLRFLLLTSRKR